ncbi:MAG: carboxymuconolactone decarboxylase family protein [Deltaproteobacteria bacterium]|jgi:4-carboxymuconolactone decarboxylase
MEVLDERRAKGIKDEIGKEAGTAPADFDKDEYGAKVRAKLAGRDDIPPPSGWQLFAPVIDTFVKEHLFADIFVRDVLNYQQRELATVAAIANMTGTEGQLRFHFGAAMNTGVTEPQMKDVMSILGTSIDKKRVGNAEEVLNSVLNKRGNLNSIIN